MLQSSTRRVEDAMDQQTFEAELKRDGYDVMTNTTPGAKVNPKLVAVDE